MEIKIKIEKNQNGGADVTIEGLGDAVTFETYDKRWADNILPKAQTAGLAESLDNARQERDLMRDDSGVQMLFSRFARVLTKEAVILDAMGIEKAIEAESAPDLVDGDAWKMFAALAEETESELPDGVTREAYNSLLGLEG